MSQEGVDYSYSKPTTAELKAAGKTFVCRYLSYLPSAKVITSAELRDLHAAGIGVVFNWEHNSGDMLQGHGIGVNQATEAKRQMAALGVPNNIPVYFSCDRDITTAPQMNAVASYLVGASSVLGHSRIGVYGEYDVVNYMLTTYAAWGWQARAWSGARISAEAHLYQYQNGATVAGNTVDLDRSLKDNFGAYFPATRKRTMIPLAGYSTPQLMEGDDDSKTPGYNDVTRAQILLNYVTGHNLVTDGRYGPLTTDAVHSLPTENSGKTIGLNEWVILYGLSKATP